MSGPTAAAPPTADPEYARRLGALEGAWWKRVLDVQRPYRWHLRRLRLGFILDIGCGLGRNLINAGGAGAGVGIDHNPDSVAIARARGLTAFTPEDFVGSEYATAGRFDGLVLSHVAEHMRFAEASELLRRYLPFVRANGRALLVTPQEAGFASDATHVEFMDLAALRRLASSAGLEPVKAYSFPFPRPLGRVFKYNEFVLIARKP